MNLLEGNVNGDEVVTVDGDEHELNAVAALFEATNVGVDAAHVKGYAPLNTCPADLCTVSRLLNVDLCLKHCQPAF